MPQKLYSMTAVLLCFLLAACGGGSDNPSTSNLNNGSATNQSPQPDTGAANASAGPTSTGSNATGGTQTTGAGNADNTGVASVGNPASSSGTPSSGFTVDSTARFNRPGDVALDGAGNLYVMDSGNQVIRKITANGNVSTLAGTYNQSSRLAAAKDGTLFVLDGSDLLKVAHDGKKATLASYPPGPGHYMPRYITVDAKGRVYLLLWYRNDYKIERYDLDNTHLTAYTFSSQGTVYDMASDAAGNLMVGLTNGFVPNQSYLMSIPQSIQAPVNNPSSPATRTISMSSPEKLAFDPDGNVYIADAALTPRQQDTASNQTIDVTAMQLRKLDAANNVTTLLNGFPDGRTTPRTIQSDVPIVIGLAVDDRQTVYLSDPFDHAIYKLDQAGHFALVAGKPGEAGKPD